MLLCNLVHVPDMSDAMFILQRHFASFPIYVFSSAFVFVFLIKKINKCESWDRAGPNILYAAFNVNLPKTVFIKDYHKQQVSSSIISNSLTIYHIISP